MPDSLLQVGGVEYDVSPSSQAMRLLSDAGVTRFALGAKGDLTTSALTIGTGVILGVSSTGPYPTIQAAIDALPSGGGTIILEPGTYAPAILTGKTNVQIVGSGWGTKIQIPAGSQANGIAVISSSNVRIANLQIDGNKGNTDNGGTAYITVNGVWVDAGSRVTVEGCYIHDCYSGGILFEGAVTGPSTECWALNNYCVDNRDNGVFVRPDCSEILISGNVCKGGDYYGVGAIHSDHLTIVHNTCTDNGPSNGEGAGITLAGCRYSIVAGNTCYDNALQGIKVETTTEGGTQRSLNVIIEGNLCQGHPDSGDSGIEVMNSDRVTVRGNIIRGAYWGVHVGGTDAPNTTTYVSVVGNKIENSVTHAVLANSATGLRTVVADNDIDVVSNYMIWIDEPLAVIQNNRLWGGTSDGIVLSGSADGSLVLHNTINCAGNGVLIVAACANAVVQGNTGVTTGAVSMARLVLEQAASGPTLCVDNVPIGMTSAAYSFTHADSRWIGMLAGLATSTYQVGGAPITMPNVPTADPSSTGAVFANADVLTVSTP